MSQLSLLAGTWHVTHKNVNTGLFSYPCHSHVRATTQCKQAPAYWHIVRCSNALICSSIYCNDRSIYQ